MDIVIQMSLFKSAPMMVITENKQQHCCHIFCLELTLIMI